MDFNRHIHKRVDELENAVSSARNVQRVRNVGFSVHPSFPLRVHNPYSLTRASGHNSLSLMVRLSVRVATAGRIALMAGSNLVAFVDFETLGLQEQIIMQQVRFSGNGGNNNSNNNNSVTLSLHSLNGFTGLIEAVQIVLVGDNANLSLARRDFGAVVSGNNLGILSSINDQLFVHSCPLNNTNNLQSNSLGSGTIADIVQDGAGGFFVAFRDNSGNIVITHRTQSGATRSLVAGQQNVTSLALEALGDNIFLYYIENGLVFSCTVNKSLTSISAPTQLQNEQADAISFVKNATAPVLLLERQGRIFARFSVDSSAVANSAVALNTNIQARIE